MILLHRPPYDLPRNVRALSNIGPGKQLFSHGLDHMLALIITSDPQSMNYKHIVEILVMFICHSCPAAERLSRLKQVSQIS
jgi:hypothetical protein